MKPVTFFKDSYIDILATVLAGILVWKYRGLSNFVIAGFILSGISIILWIAARIQLGSSFELAPKAKELVTHGLYSKLRHPIYIFSTLAGLGLTIALGHWVGYVLLGLLITIQLVRLKKEEEILAKAFGENYLQYKSKTWL